MTIPEHINYVDNSFYLVTRIGDEAFSGCSDLSHVDIPNTVVSIGNRAFYGCHNILSISIPESIESIGSYAFYDCWFQHVSINDLVAWCNIKFDSYKSNPVSSSRRVYLYGEDVIDLEIPEDVTEIKDYAFCNFTYLKSVVIPYGVNKIGRRAFADSKFLEDINISDSIMYIGTGAFDNTKWFDNHPDGVVYAGLHAYGYKGKMPVGANIEISEGTKSIVERAFEGCKELNTISIANSVETIGEYSFEHCFSLEDIVIPSGVREIGSGSFFDCSSLQSIEIGNNVTTIGESAFGWCPNLSVVKCMAESIPNASENAFDGSLNNSILYVPTSAISKYKKIEPWSKFKKILTLDGEEVEETDFITPRQNEENSSMSIFSVDGKLINQIHHGINIIHTTNKKPIKVISHGAASKR